MSTSNAPRSHSFKNNGFICTHRMKSVWSGKTAKLSTYRGTLSGKWHDAFREKLSTFTGEGLKLLYSQTSDFFFGGGGGLVGLRLADQHLPYCCKEKDALFLSPRPPPPFFKNKFLLNLFQWSEACEVAVTSIWPRTSLNENTTEKCKVTSSLPRFRLTKLNTSLLRKSYDSMNNSLRNR